jgi:hypothetical protein
MTLNGKVFNMIKMAMGRVWAGQSNTIPIPV